jgi:F-type H+-transporting ATPase subunit epsilon
MTIKLHVVTAEGVVYSDDVDEVVIPGSEGQLAILPHHAPLMTMIAPGELTIRKRGTDSFLAVSGGFLEVYTDRIIILADTAEQVEEIDIARAEGAKLRAQDKLKSATNPMDSARAEASLRRAVNRLAIADRRRKRRIL